MQITTQKTGDDKNASFQRQEHAGHELKTLQTAVAQMRTRALSAEDAAASAEARVQTLQEDIQMLEQTVGEGRRMLHHKLAGVPICVSFNQPACMRACVHACKHAYTSCMHAHEYQNTGIHILHTLALTLSFPLRPSLHSTSSLPLVSSLFLPNKHVGLSSSQASRSCCLLHPIPSPLSSFLLSLSPCHSYPHSPMQAHACHQCRCSMSASAPN